MHIPAWRDLSSMSAKILLVDDDRYVVRYLKKALEQAGYDVSATTSGKQALELMDEQKPDLLILDLNMPEPDGFDLLRMEHAKFPYLRIIVISGYLEGALLEAAKIFGAVATLQKPVSPADLVNKVREVLAR
jgi:two-component system cell cycle response regulator CpdR